MPDDAKSAISALADRLAHVLDTCGGGAIAVSGGVDSMTLSSFAHRRLGGSAGRMIHAVSPAVPAAATARVRALAAKEGWRLDVINAGEFADERYRSNPVNRCFFCKSNLYQSLGAMADGVLLSGTNIDDLADYRPGLEAAADNDVRHPFVEAGLAKSDVRALARRLDLADLAELPASPCLASRVETGLRIEAADMVLIDGIETWLRDQLAPKTVRCRLRPGGLVVELDPERLTSLTADQRLRLVAGVRSRFPKILGRDIDVTAYRRGSAFIQPDGTVH